LSTERTYDIVVTREALGIRQKPKKRRRAFPRSRLLSLPVVAGLAALLFHLFTAPVFTVQSAVIQGNALLPAQTIYDSSLVGGQNVFVVNTRAAAQAVERLPYVKRAWVHVLLPSVDGTPSKVAIIVQEYQPRWVWIAGDNQFWIDETGNVLPDGGQLPGGLRVVDPSGRPLRVGSTLDRRVVNMLDALSLTLPQLSRVTFDHNVGFIVSIGRGWPVRIGWDPQELLVKIGILNSLLPDLERTVAEGNREIEFIDLRYAEQPYYRLK
jgi:cell division septal protein FtsQ